MALSHSHIFPEEWRVRRLDGAIKDGDVVLGRGRIVSKPYMSEHPGPYPVYSSAATNRGLFGHCSEYMFEEQLITWSVDGGGKFFYRPRHRFSVTNVSGFLQIRSHSLDHRFLHAALDYQHSRLHFDYVSKAHPSVIEKLYYVPRPPLPEQRKIAEILSTVDETIEKTGAIIQETKQLKKGLMQKLLREGIGHSRFRETKIGRVPEEWKVKELADITERIIVGLATSVTKHYRAEGVPIIRNLNILGDQFDDSDILCLDPAFADMNQKKAVKLDDVLTVHTGNVGISCLVPEKYVGSQTFTTLITTTQNARLLPKYLCYHLNSDIGQNEIIRRRLGGTRNNLNVGDFVHYNIWVPPINEQRKIVEILSGVDAKVEREEAYKSELEQLKKGLMQVLLTGKVRVKV